MAWRGGAELDQMALLFGPDEHFRVKSTLVWSHMLCDLGTILQPWDVSHVLRSKMGAVRIKGEGRCQRYFRDLS